jgi:hypothetical protein
MLGAGNYVVRQNFIKREGFYENYRFIILAGS